MADGDLTTVATAAGELGLTASDARVIRLVTAASEAIRRYLGRAQLHYQAARVEKVRGFGRQRLVLEVTPVLSVASVVLGDGSTVDASEYEIEDAEAGFLWRDGGWPYTGAVRPGMMQVDPAVGTEKAEIAVTYTGGWVTPAQAAGTGWAGPARSLPADLEHVALETITSMYRRGGADRDVLSESLGDYSASYRQDVGAGGLIPAALLPQLDVYRRRMP